MGLKAILYYRCLGISFFSFRNFLIIIKFPKTYIIFFCFYRFSDEYDPEETLSASEDDENLVDVTKGEEDMDISHAWHKM